MNNSQNSINQRSSISTNSSNREKLQNQTKLQDLAIVITSTVTRSLCTVLGMRARGHGDSKIEAHPQTRILMSLSSAMKTATHLRLFHRIKSSTRRSLGIKSSTWRSPGVGRTSCQRSFPCQRPQGSDGLWRRSPVCRRSLHSITWQGGHASHPHSWGTEMFVNLKRL
jgi:hypothetical protein